MRNIRSPIIAGNVLIVS